MLSIRLRDMNSDVVSAWSDAFSDLQNVSMSCGDIFEQDADAIVSPANSFGFMDGGIDLIYSRFFGWEVEERLKRLLTEQYYGELPIGQAVIIATENATIPFLISAPTMRVPSNISKTFNVYLAFRAALIAVLRHNQQSNSPIESILVPGLGTGIGDVPPERAARQMRAAYDAIIAGEGITQKSARELLNSHRELLL